MFCHKICSELFLLFIVLSPVALFFHLFLPLPCLLHLSCFFFWYYHHYYHLNLTLHMYFRPQAAEKALRTSEQVLVSMAMTHLSVDPARLPAPHCSFCHSQEEQSLTFNNKKRLVVVFLCSSTNSLIDPWSSPWHSPYLTWISGPNVQFEAALSPWPWQQVAIEVVGFTDTSVTGILHQSQGAWCVFLEPY